MRYRIAFVALVVLLAGCAFFSGGGSNGTALPTDGPTDTTGSNTTVTTAAATGTGAPADTASSMLAPGVSENGIENLSTLLSAHREELLADGFEARTTIEDRYTGTLADRVTQHFAVGPDGTRVSLNETEWHLTNDGVNGSTDVWMTNSTTVVRQMSPNGTEYTTADRQFPRRSTPFMSTSLFEELSTDVGAFDVTSVTTRDGTRFVTVSATMDRIEDRNGTEDTEMRLVVDERGVVHRYDVVVEFNVSTWRATYEVERIGGVDPQRPTWVDEANETDGT